MRIENGREHFYQWDVNQRLIIENEIIHEIHFSIATLQKALVVEVYEENGKRFADVPNILLQGYWDIKAYGYCGECVRQEKIFEVEARNKPEDYVYTETEIKRYEDLESRIEYLEKNGTGTGGGVGIESVILTDEDGGYNIVNFTDGNKLQVKNGETGKAGKQGESVRITSIEETQEGNTVKFSDGNSMFVANGSGGESVYIGTETPDDNANVWINPEGEASTEGVYELIETITTEEEVSLVARNKEPNGNEYNFKKIYIDIKTPTGSEKKVGVVSVTKQAVPIAYLNNMIDTSAFGSWAKVFSHIDGNVLRGSAVCGSNGASQLGWSNANPYIRGFGEVGVINIDYAQASIISGKFPAGTIIEIWGVRA